MDWIKNVGALAFGLGIALVLVEIVLRIYTPFISSVRGDEILLPKSFKQHYINKYNYPDTDKKILYARNSLGFRGGEPGLDYDLRFKIYTVGGSTTECSTLSEGQTWPDILAKNLSKSLPSVWLNNAGFNGHTTHAHIILLRDHLLKLKPDMVLFLIGINDLILKDSSPIKSRELELTFAFFEESGKKKFSIGRFLGKYSEFYNLIINVIRLNRAASKNLSYIGSSDVFASKKVNPLKSEDARRLTGDELKSLFQSHKNSLARYENRIRILIDLSLKNTLDPVFVTQPAMFSCGSDPSTGVQYSKVKIWNHDGCTDWQLLEKYNDVLRRVAREKKVILIDLAVLLPHDSKYYIDYMHYTRTGARKIGEILAEQLEPVISAKIAR